MKKRAGNILVLLFEQPPGRESKRALSDGGIRRMIGRISSDHPPPTPADSVFPGSPTTDQRHNEARQSPIPGNINPSGLKASPAIQSKRYTILFGSRLTQPCHKPRGGLLVLPRQAALTESDAFLATRRAPREEKDPDAPGTLEHLTSPALKSSQL